MSDVRVLVLFVWTDCVKRLHSEDTNYRAKSVRLL
jgi:hypothetical protein